MKKEQKDLIIALLENIENDAKDLRQQLQEKHIPRRNILAKLHQITNNGDDGIRVAKSKR